MFHFFSQIFIIFTWLWMLTFFSVWREAFPYFSYACLCQIWHVSLSLEKHFHISRMHLVAKFGIFSQSEEAFPHFLSASCCQIRHVLCATGIALSFLTCATGIMYICTVYIHLHGFLKICTFCF